MELLDGAPPWILAKLTKLTLINEANLFMRDDTFNKENGYVN